MMPMIDGVSARALSASLVCGALMIVFSGIFDLVFLGAALGTAMFSLYFTGAARAIFVGILSDEDVIFIKKLHFGIKIFRLAGGISMFFSFAFAVSFAFFYGTRGFLGVLPPFLLTEIFGRAFRRRVFENAVSGGEASIFPPCYEDSARRAADYCRM